MAAYMYVRCATMNEQNDFVTPPIPSRHSFLFWQICKTYEQACAEVDRTIVYIIDTIAALKSLDNSSSSFEVASGVIAQVRCSVVMRQSR
jgi:hypothetical protein